MAKALSVAKCTLLAVDFASKDDIASLHDLCALRPDALPANLVLRILLTYLPETIPAESYIPLVEQLTAAKSTLPPDEHASLDLSSIHDTTDADAKHRADRVYLYDLRSDKYPSEGPGDDLTLFLCHRAYRVDQETGLLALVANLIRPFATANNYLRCWYLSVLLPLYRLQYDYHPQRDLTLSVLDFEDISPTRGVDLLLVNATKTSSDLGDEVICRDLRGLVAPWLSGNFRSHRRLAQQSPTDTETLVDGRRISLSGNTQDTVTNHDWEYVFAWLVHRAATDFVTVINAVELWDGPSDVDFDGLGKAQDYLDADTLKKLDKRYAQAMFASCYVVDQNCKQAIDGAHGVLVRLASLLDFEPPPDLATSVEQLPLLDEHAARLNKETSPKLLQPDRLLEPEHALTSPTLETYMLLQMFVYSAYQLQALGQSISIGNVARMRYFDNADEQLAVLQKIVSALAQKGKRDDRQWQTDRSRLVWLWNWNLDPAEENARQGAGPLGRVDRDLLERNILRAMIDTSNYSLIERIYLDEKQGSTRLSMETLQQIILAEAMRCYDSASNGNRTRGSMKKASDIINTFKPRFPDSFSYSAASALLAATHALSFYSLTLQQGVPFQPANLRASSDPLSLLIPKVLSQNARSYTKLDDLVAIGQNLVVSSVHLGTNAIDQDPSTISMSSSDQSVAVKTAERKVVYMCIEAALDEDDFDTAYSYLVSRLAPALPGALTNAQAEHDGKDEEPDDMSWRAAFLAGKFAGSTTTDSQKTVRRLEQRIELLSLALLLAPKESLLEILSVYRRCEEALMALVAAQSEGEDTTLTHRPSPRSAANGREVSALPGEWEASRTEGMVYGQRTREMGRLASSLAQDRLGPSRSSHESARPGSATSVSRERGGREPESEETLGLFDVARGAAAAFSRNAILRPGSAASSTKRSVRPDSPGVEGNGELSPDFDEHGRVRKRDVVANAVSGTTNAVTGTLTSGLGWMLGATPVERQQGRTSSERRAE